MDTISSDRQNNFRLIRLVAASAVILSHAFVLTGGWNALAQEPFHALIGITASEIAVNVFFITSGYLVSKSLINRGSIFQYVLARSLRIYPALIVVVLLAAFVLGPAVTTLATEEYFATKSVYGYVGYNAILLFPLKMRYELPGVFGGLPYPSVVNGSLWTLPWELWMYIGLVGLSLARLLQPVRALVSWIVLFVAHVGYSVGLIDLSVTAAIALRFSVYFSTGTLFFLFRDRVQLAPRVLLVLAGLYVLSVVVVNANAILPIVLAYLVFFLAFYPRLIIARLSDGADFSYGIYLYAYPVQQFLVHAGFPGEPYLNAAATFLLTLPFAVLSWYVIEEPALRLKTTIGKAFGRRKAKVADAA